MRHQWTHFSHLIDESLRKHSFRSSLLPRDSGKVLFKTTGSSIIPQLQTTSLSKHCWFRGIAQAAFQLSDLMAVCRRPWVYVRLSVLKHLWKLLVGSFCLSKEVQADCYLWSSSFKCQACAKHGMNLYLYTCAFMKGMPLCLHLLLQSERELSSYIFFGVKTSMVLTQSDPLKLRFNLDRVPHRH